MVLSGRILVDGEPVDKAGAAVRDGAQLRLRGDDQSFVSRGGEKLEGALPDLGFDPGQYIDGRACVDIGASTGGFTDCLLRHGAKSVVAVDVGRGLLHETLRQDPRVTLLERTNARTLAPEDLPGGIELVVIDVSFISLTRILDRVRLAAPTAHVLALVKPQFEVGKEQVGKGGVVRDDALRAEAVGRVSDFALAQGYRVVAQADSRVHGPKGNREIFLWLALA